ncbi:hypothetical protein D3C86_1752340 [compost metagenome]
MRAAGAQEQVLQHRHFGEQLLALGRLDEAQGYDVVWLAADQRFARELDLAARGAQQPGHGA